MAANSEPDKNGIFTGTMFTSFEELEKEITKYRAKTLSSSTKGIHGPLRRAPNRKVNPAVSSIPGWCTLVFMGGRNSNLSPRGKDYNSSKSKSVIIVILPYLCLYDWCSYSTLCTFRKECPAELDCVHQKMGNALLLEVWMNEEHNHKLSKVCHVQIPIF